MPQKTALVKADLFTCGNGTVSLLIKLPIGSENFAVIVCVCGQFLQIWSQIAVRIDLGVRKCCIWDICFLNRVFWLIKQKISSAKISSTTQ